MEKDNNSFLVLSLLTIIIIICLFLSAIFVWNTYKEDIIDKQKEQMLIVSESVSRNFSDMIEFNCDFINQLSYQLEVFDDIDTFTKLIPLYINENNHYLQNINIKSEQYTKNTTNIYTKDDITIYECIDDELIFVFEKTLSNNHVLQTEVNLYNYYLDNIAPITIGENGYIIVKNSNSIILMHPTDIQIGEHVIYGREELYEEVNLESLTLLIEKQNSNDFGVYEYYSYWWTYENLPAVRKIASHNHVNIGDDFLILSAVIDYDDIYIPIQAGFRNSAFIFCAILFVTLGFSAYIAILLFESHKNREEIIYLKELNSVLEETKKVEENITHQQRLQIMGTMTSGIAHEFNNILTPIMGYAELMKCDLDPESEHFEFVDEILNTTEKAKDIIKQFSSLSRKKDVPFSFVKAKKMLFNSTKMINSICPSDVFFEMNNDISSYYGFLGNETQINQVILNLFVNATHAVSKVENKKISIISSIAPKDSIEIKHKQYISSIWDDYLELKFIDNGCGMDKQTLEQIFNPFFTTKQKGEGTGLGLSLVLQIINSHEGYIFANSVENVGSEFYVYLPIAKNPKNIRTKNSDKIEILFVGNKIDKNLDKNLQKLGICSIFVDNVVDARVVLAEGAKVMVIDKDLTTPKGSNRGINFAMSIHSQYPDVLKIVKTDYIDKAILDAIDKGYIHNHIESKISPEKLFNIMRKSN